MMIGILTIKWAKRIDDGNIQLLSNNGQVVLSKDFSGIEALELNLEQIEEGVYYLLIKTNEGNRLCSMVKI